MSTARDLDKIERILSKKAKQEGKDRYVLEIGRHINGNGFFCSYHTINLDAWQSFPEAGHGLTMAEAINDLMNILSGAGCSKYKTIQEFV